ncbi:hypothetical protein QTJ16_005499 [Diplocarpon rosae]|uniref:Uncharacterized protein n=1 Tax=Diplocarpon rosae TaxID=946125 RepID=A0AAD9SYQ9_9HELO|nr:hypothetical protein QTJ16_005499 [Diplocarpon rosae]
MAKDAYNTAKTELTGLSNTIGADSAPVSRAERILQKQADLPDKMAEEALALVLRYSGSLDDARGLSPKTESLLFNFELTPLRKEVQRLKTELKSKDNTGNGTEADALRATIEVLQEQNGILLKRNAELGNETQQIFETQKWRDEETNFKKRVAEQDESLEIAKKQTAVWKSTLESTRTNAEVGLRASNKSREGALRKLIIQLHHRYEQLLDARDISNNLKAEINAQTEKYEKISKKHIEDMNKEYDRISNQQTAMEYEAMHEKMKEIKQLEATPRNSEPEHNNDTMLITVKPNQPSNSERIIGNEKDQLSKDTQSITTERHKVQTRLQGLEDVTIPKLVDEKLAVQKDM